MPKPTTEKAYIEVKGEKVPVKIHREYRRSIRFSIGKRGAIMRLPVHLPAEQQHHEWERFVKWVRKKIESEEGAQKAFGKSYSDGDRLSVGGRTYQLKIENTSNKTHSGRLEGNRVISIRLSAMSNEEQRKRATQHLLSRLVADDFKPEITRRVLELNQQFFQKKINSVNLKYNRSNWGSCSTKGNINLSTCLLFAPADVIDYVIIHELAHLIEMNHSPRFWALVEGAMPDYKEKKKWLRQNWQICNF